ncbi:MAG: hypothetical protein M0C28_24970 [Candidatus Moduliflexus flocculans]|nr:hypothetical protein [Candidatus Moduliflexus flocculans]
MIGGHVSGSTLITGDTIDTGGGACIRGNVNTGGGKFVGRDDRSTVAPPATATPAQLPALLQELRIALAAVPLDADERAALQDDLAVVEAQWAKPEPKRALLRGQARRPPEPHRGGGGRDGGHGRTAAPPPPPRADIPPMTRVPRVIAGSRAIEAQQTISVMVPPPQHRSLPDERPGRPTAPLAVSQELVRQQAGGQAAVCLGNEPQAILAIQGLPPGTSTPSVPARIGRAPDRAPDRARRSQSG